MTFFWTYLQIFHPNLQPLQFFLVKKNDALFLFREQLPLLVRCKCAAKRYCTVSSYPPQEFKSSLRLARDSGNSGFPGGNPSSQSVKTPRSWCVSCQLLPESITRERTRCRTGPMICLSRRCRLSSGSVTPAVHTRAMTGRAARVSPFLRVSPWLHH